ncbi:MAG: Phosphoglucosamine mutase [Lentisphaerae bacterium ADurb.Bin242]|nr:MAG: Phosphoglucosamine mutase [Lentisphaerae bacterium ADurb.Bin242]
MMGKLFGTDGIRGRANVYPITPETALRVGKAIAHVFGAQGQTAPRVVLGKDTRLSGYMLETALTSGLVGMGASVLEIGPLPTPSIAHLTRSMCADCGIMITASHNPSTDNGIKIFSADGYKLPDEVEDEIERYILAAEQGNDLVGSEKIGKAFRIDDARGRYIEFAKSSIKNHSLKGIKAVLDCANGAAYSIAPLILRELGVEVIATAVNPDGYNINADCGATHPENMTALVRRHHADIGISLDGDADRVIFSDAKGRVVNGDRIMGLCALDYKARNRLANNTIAVTGMSNLGLLAAMKEAEIQVEITQVGDRYVIEKMRELNLNLGGEQSGHLIFLDYATTGDGIISALHVLRLMKRHEKSLHELSRFMEEYPQKLVSLPVRERVPIDQLPLLSAQIREATAALGGSGRVNVRYSGTENKIRVLVEARSASDMERWLGRLTETVKKELV